MSPPTTNKVHQIAISEFDSFKCFQSIYKLRLLQTIANAPMHIPIHQVSIIKEITYSQLVMHKHHFPYIHPGQQ